jgi:flavorubredoxin
VEILREIKDKIYWVGAIDWKVRNFHGYITHKGTTYNSYLIVDEEIALVDFSKKPFFDEMLGRIKEVVDPEEIDYLISNHAEPDHSESLVEMTKEAPQAEIIASERGVNALQKYYGPDLPVTSITEKPKLDLGSNTLNFVAVPMAHWPDSMVTYIPEEKILLSNDAFGQHLASSGRFDDEVDQNLLMKEVAAYYANILMPLWRSVKRAMDALEGIEIDVIAPSHGVIWRENPGKILELYQRWIIGETTEKAVIVYDTMWKSTEKIAKSLSQGIMDEGVEVNIHNLDVSHRSDVMTDILDARAVLIGSPTLNNHVFPTVAGFLAYMRGLKPQNKIGAAFGSYGWAGGAKRYVESEMKAAGIELLESDLEFVYRPTDLEYEKTRDFGRMVAKRIKEG